MCLDDSRRRSPRMKLQLTRDTGELKKRTQSHDTSGLIKGRKDCHLSNIRSRPSTSITRASRRMSQSRPKFTVDGFHPVSLEESPRLKNEPFSSEQALFVMGASPFLPHPSAFLPSSPKPADISITVHDSSEEPDAPRSAHDLERGVHDPTERSLLSKIQYAFLPKLQQRSVRFISGIAMVLAWIAFMCLATYLWWLVIQRLFTMEWQPGGFP